MAVYGELLSAFPELMQEIQIFSMKPRIGGGYHERVPLFTVRGAFIREGKSKMKVQGEARVENQAGVLYCFDRLPRGQVNQGTYFEHDREIFVVADDQTFSIEGGFSVYTVQVVQGLTDKQVENKQVVKNIVADYTP